MNASLAHVCIESADLAATERFYNALGLRRQFDFRNRQGELVGYYLGFGNRTFLEVIKVANVAADGRILHFAVEVESVDAARHSLMTEGYEVAEKTLGGDRTWMATCTDPSGVYIEIHEYAPDSMQLVGGTCEVDYQP